MSSNGADHNYYPVPPRRRPSDSSGLDLSTPSADYDVDGHRYVNPRDSTPPLLTYNQRQSVHASPNRPTVSTRFEQYASNASVNGFTSEPPDLIDSPDPFLYYNKYREVFGTDSGEGVDDTGHFGRNSDHDMATLRSPQISTPVTARTNGYKSSPLSSRYNTGRSDARSSPSQTQERNSIASAKSNPQLSTTARSRQPSLQALVNKFNQTPDEVPPLPSKPGSRSTSTTTSRATAHGPKTFKARTSQGSAGTTRPSYKTGERSVPTTQRSESTLSSFRHNRYMDGDNRSSSVTPNDARTKRKLVVSSNAHASQSMTDLGPAKADNPRKPLFGELLAVNTTVPDLGYGIPTQQRRRGSEGSMHHPNPMFPNESANYPPKVSPSSPTAWYLGFNPSLEGIDLDKPVPARPPGMHRRSRSDFAGSYTKPTHATSLGKSIAILSPPQESPSPLVSPTNIKRNSQSRIPISTRRMSTTSDSGNSSPSTRPNSMMSHNTPHQQSSAHQQNTAHRKPSAIAVSVYSKNYRSSNSSSPEQHHKMNSSRQSPKRRNRSPLRQHPATVPSPLLKAYISDAPSTRSPPLRSSRPRQPVSTATTSASRARAVDQMASTVGRNTSRTQNKKQKDLPELGGIDFAARRQRIQQAFTKTISEHEKKEEAEAERRRMQSLQDSLLPTTAEHGEGSGIQVSETLAQQPESADSELQDIDVERYATPMEEMSRSDRELTIDTTHFSERSVLDLSQEDSPTLGVAHRFLDVKTMQNESPSPPSEPEPMSAVTAGTTETFFEDNEPREETPSPGEEHRTLLSHVIDMRKASPTPNQLGAQEIPHVNYSPSDNGDEGSIHIMLGQTPVNESRNSLNELQETLPAISYDRSESDMNLSSWTLPNVPMDLQSSVDRASGAPVAQPGEPISEEPEEITHTSLSTTASSFNIPTWSPDSPASFLSGRTTLDSDSYNTINQVFDSYHDPSLISPEHINDFQRRIFSQSPNLAREGGWDPQKVTQLYLQSLGRTKYTQSSAVPEPLRLISKTSTDAPDPGSPASQNGDNVRETNTEVLPETPTEEAGIEDFEIGDGSRMDNLEATRMVNPQRASLNRPDDWANTSPSMLDWMSHQAADTSTDDEEHNPIPRHRRGQSLEVPDPFNSDRSLPLRMPVHAHPELPSIPQTEDGLGINIKIESPRDDAPLLATAYNDSRGTISPTPAVPVVPRKRFSSSSIGKPLPRHRGSSTDITADRGINSSSASTAPSAESSRDISQKQNSVDEARSEARPSISESVSKSASPPPDSKRLTRRRHILKELVDTEYSFCQDMKVVTDIYRETGLEVLTTDDIKVLFSNSDQIVTFSTTFLDALKTGAKSVYVLSRSKRWKSNRDSTATSTSGGTDDRSSMSGLDLNDDDKDRKTFIGETFMNHMEQMEKVYTEYLKNHDAANQRLAKLQKDYNATCWLAECKTHGLDLTTAWDLDSLLVKPVQRILKYPLLLKELLEVTPENHPDFVPLDSAAREMVGVSVRINEMKKRAELVEQVAVSGKKRKDFEARIALPKAFGRRTEKLRQQVGVHESFQDKQYDTIADKYGTDYFQLQVVLRDIEMYTSDVQNFVKQFNDFVLGIEALIDVGHSTSPMAESKWRKFRMSVREILTTALPEHINAVRKNVIDPMVTLVKIHEGPQRFMDKRKKRVTDYTRLRAIKLKGEKPDKKLSDQGDQFVALNETLKDELPKLYILTTRLVEACLENYVQLQLQWQIVWRKKLSQVFDDNRIPNNVSEIVKAFNEDFQYTEAQVLCLGICNGSLLADAGANLVNFLSPSTTLNGEDSPRRPSTQTMNSVDSRNRAFSNSSDVSPRLPPPDFGGDPGASLGLSHLGSNGLNIATSHQPGTGRRIRASSTASGRSPQTPEIPGGWRSYSNSTTPVVSSHPNRPSTSTGRNNESPSLPRLSVESSLINRHSGESPSVLRPSPNTTYYNGQRDTQARSSSPSHRYSGFFSSAMPMSDSPRPSSPTEDLKPKVFNVLFLAASVYEFNIDRARQEGGYPYLTYVAGEIFDVIAEKGELWLAKNQDDSSNQVGWIWNKHFAKLAS